MLDLLLHGINHETEPALLISPYVHLMQELVNQHLATDEIPRLSWFFAGAGSYTQQRAVRHLAREANTVGAELDPLVTATVAESMFVDPAEFTILHGDARTTQYRQSSAAFDVIVTDAFYDIAIPYHLVTLQYARLAKSKLKPGGLFTTNVVDAFPDPRIVKSRVNTLRRSLSEVDVWLDRIPEQPLRMTYWRMLRRFASRNDFLG